MATSKLAAPGVFFVAFVWGAEFVLVHDAIEFLEPHSFNAIRFGVAALFMALCGGLPHPLRGVSRPLVFHGCFLGLLLYLGFTLQTFGLLYTTVSKSGFITSLNVVFVPLLAHVLLKDGLQRSTAAGVGISAAGLTLLTSAGQDPFNFGDLLTLLCAMVFALHLIYTGRLGQQHDPLKLTLVQLGSVCVLSTGSMVLFDGGQGLPDPGLLATPIVIAAVLVTAILGTGMALFIQTFAQNHLTATQVALIFTTEPIFASLTAFLVLNENLTRAAGMGALMIIGGIVVTELPAGAWKRTAPAGKS